MATRKTKAIKARELREDRAEAFRALADPTRLQMLEIIGRGPVGSAEWIRLRLDRDLSQPTISHHIGILRDAGLVRGEKHGVFMAYEIATDRLETLGKWLTGGVA